MQPAVSWITRRARQCRAPTTTNQAASLIRSRASVGRSVPIGNDPDFGELFVLAVVPVILGQHFPEFARQGVGALRRVCGRLAGLMVPDAEAGAATIAEFKGFDGVQRVLRNFLV